MGFLDIIRRIFGLIGVSGPTQSPQQPASPPSATPEPPRPVDPPPTPPSGADPNRFGDFIIPDVYPKDLDNPNTPAYELPPFAALPGLVVQGKEVIGCYVKCSEGLGWGAKNEQWFRDCWREIKRVGMGDLVSPKRYGTDWFRGCYHFLRFTVSGAAQADYCLDLIESAGGWGEGDLMLWVDVEEGGQGTWANDPVTGAARKLEDIGQHLPAERQRLAAEVTKCTSDFVARVKQRYPNQRVGIYGRGVFRDLHMTSCKFGADACCNPAYTKTMPRMEAYGWPLEDIVEWQLCGDGDVVAAGYPSKLPGWGATDYSAVVFGTHPVGMADVRRRCLARPK